jgi:hypothetical protein
MFAHIKSKLEDKQQAGNEQSGGGCLGAAVFLSLTLWLVTRPIEHVNSERIVILGFPFTLGSCQG